MFLLRRESMSAALALLAAYVHAVPSASMKNITDGNSTFDQVANDIFSTASDITAAPSIIAILAITVGAVVALFGYKLFRPVLFICGFTVGSVVFYLIAEQVFKDQSYLLTAAWISFVAGGIIVGTTVVCIWKLGVFMVGAAAGILLAFLVNNTVGYRIWPSNPTEMLYVLIVGLGLVGGVMARCLERPFLIISTSFFGAVAVVWGIGYFAGQYPSGSDLESLRVQLDSGDFVYSISPSWWGYLVGTVVVFLFSVYVQFSKTALGIHHHARRTNEARAYHLANTPTIGQPAMHIAPY